MTQGQKYRQLEARCHLETLPLASFSFLQPTKAETIVASSQVTLLKKNINLEWLITQSFFIIQVPFTKGQ